MDFNTENFIYEVQQRPSIWDLRCTDKNKKIQQWDEIITIYGGNEMSPETRKNLGLTLQKKWKNIRDSFVKELKKLSGIKKEPAKKSAYTYYNNLIFLQDTVNLNQSDINVDEQEASTSQIEEDTVAPLRLPTKRFKTISRKDQLKKMKALVSVQNKTSDVTPNDDEDRMFFLSLVKDFKKVPEHLQLQTKSEIIQVIINAQMGAYQPSTTWTYQQPQEPEFCTVQSTKVESPSIESMISSPDTL